MYKIRMHRVILDNASDPNYADNVRALERVGANLDAYVTSVRKVQR